jgi:phage terminase large subunit
VVRDRLLHDPAAFAEVVLGHNHWWVPEQIMEDISKPRARVVVKSCNASSKTYSAADIAVWAVAGGNLVLTTAPTSNQVEEIMWPQIREAYASALQPLGGRCLTQELEIGAGKATGISTDQAVRLQGYHARPGHFFLIIVDEGPGLRPELWAAIEGIAAGGDVRVLVLGNPLVASGPYFDLFSNPSYKHYTIDAFETPNLEGVSLEQLLAMPDHELDQDVRPYLVTRRWVRDRYLEWGEDNPEWQARVRGQFPDQGENALIGRQFIADTMARVTMVHPDTKYDGGLDVAGPGDNETVLWVRQGPRVIEQRAWLEGNTERLLKHISNGIQPYGDNLATLSVDATGIGWHLAGAIKMQHPKLTIIPVNAGGRTSQPARFTNLKAELYWLLRELFEKGIISGPLDSLTQEQLASLRWSLTYTGQIEIERKGSLRARGVASPDRAEALMLCFASLLLYRQKHSASFGGARPKRAKEAQFIRMGGRGN